MKKAIYLPDLQRVDVITALNATKEAAERNGGLVATKTLDRLNSDRDIAVSQSCKVAFDRCSSCGHEAKSRAEYCTGTDQGGHCKYGGCRDRLGRVFDNGFQLFVDNPKCTFFDLSDVSNTRGADRTAFVTGKVAHSQECGGAELAERLGLTAPDHVYDPDTLGPLAALRKLAAYRYPVIATSPRWDDCVRYRAKRADDARGSADAVQEAAAAGVVLPPAVWMEYMTGVDRAKCAAAFAGGVDAARDLLARADAHELIAETPAVAPARLKSAWDALAPTGAAHAAESALGVLAGPRPLTKAAASDAVAAAARAHYLAYQGRVLAAFAGTPREDLLMAECTRHNRGCTV